MGGREREMLTQAECLFRERSPNLTIYPWEEDVGTGDDEGQGGCGGGGRKAFH